MLHENPTCSLNLKNEVASVTLLQGFGTISVSLVDVSVSSVTFVAPQRLQAATSDQLSMRFTLPGMPRLHFAMITLLPSVTSDVSGFRYQAKFVKTAPLTIDHIVQCLNPVPVEADKGTKSQHFH